MASRQGKKFCPSGGAIYAGLLPPVPEGLPLWAADAPLNAWIEIPNTANSGADADSFCGWIKLPDGRIAIILAGGHGDGQKNNVVIINVLADAPAWSEVGMQSPSHVDDVAYQPDGKPTASHTYYTTMWVPPLNRLMRMGCTFASGQLTMNFPTVDGFSLDTNTWDAAGTHPNTPTGGGRGGEMWNSTTSRVLFVTDFGGTWFDPVTGAATAITSPSVPWMPRNPWMWDTTRNHAFGVCAGNNQRNNLSEGIVAAKIVGNVATPIAIAASAARTQFLDDAPFYMAMEHDTGNDWYLLYCGAPNLSSVPTAGRVYKVIPNNTSTWDIEILAIGSGGVTPVNTVLSGILNKFSYIPQLGGIVMMPTKLSNLYFLRTV